MRTNAGTSVRLLVGMVVVWAAVGPPAAWAGIIGVPDERPGAPTARELIPEQDDPVFAGHRIWTIVTGKPLQAGQQARGLRAFRVGLAEADDPLVAADAPAGTPFGSVRISRVDRAPGGKGVTVVNTPIRAGDCGGQVSTGQTLLAHFDAWTRCVSLHTSRGVRHRLQINLTALYDGATTARVTRVTLEFPASRKPRAGRQEIVFWVRDCRRVPVGGTACAMGAGNQGIGMWQPLRVHDDVRLQCQRTASGTRVRALTAPTGLDATAVRIGVGNLRQQIGALVRYIDSPNHVTIGENAAFTLFVPGASIPDVRVVLDARHTWGSSYAAVFRCPVR